MGARQVQQAPPERWRGSAGASTQNYLLRDVESNSLWVMVNLHCPLDWFETHLWEWFQGGLAEEGCISSVCIS